MRFFVPGIPVPQTRPRVYTHAGVTRAVSVTKKIKVWRDAVVVAAKEAGAYPADFPLDVTMTFLLPRVARAPKSKPYREPHACRPDLSNYIKCVEDALDGVAWVDDGQIARLDARKMRVELGERPAVLVEIGRFVLEEECHPDCECNNEEEL